MARPGVSDVVATPLRLGSQPVAGDRLVNEVSARALRLALRAGIDEGVAATQLVETARGDRTVLLRAWCRFDRALDSRSSAAVAQRAARILHSAVERAGAQFAVHQREG